MDYKKKDISEARKRGRELARKVIRSFDPEIQEIAAIINGHDERIVEEAMQRARELTIAWLEGQVELLKVQRFDGSPSDWTNELIKRLKGSSSI